MEGVVIVGSILMAFGIDAWWDAMQGRQEEQEYLVALLDDVDAVIAEAERTITANENISEQSRQTISTIRELGEVTDSLFERSMSSMKVFFRLRSNLDTYNDIISSGGVTKVRDPRVRRLMAELRAQMDFEAEVTEYAISSMWVMRATLVEPYGSEDPNLWRMLARVEEDGVSWRDSHILRKQDVLRAAKAAREALIAVVEHD